MQKISIDTYLTQYKNCIIIDVRSPAEYTHAHIPNAFNIPLFNNEERAIVGTAYKQQSRQIAIKIGLEIYGPKMRSIVETVEQIVQENKQQTIIVHCWRGGMRSAAIAWLLQLYGYNIKTIEGGYKAFRNFCLQQFDFQYNFMVLGGYTGSGKSNCIQLAKEQQIAAIHLEQLANHKGSTLGGIQMPKQPSQEMFENLLSLDLFTLKNSNYILVEDESQRIGSINIPKNIWLQMRVAKVYFLNIPFSERLQQVVQQYGSLPIQELMQAVSRIKKKLGGLEEKNTLSYLEENNIEAAFEILLTYYDKAYLKGLQKRENMKDKYIEITSSTTNEINNLQLIMQQIVA